MKPLQTIAHVAASGFFGLAVLPKLKYLYARHTYIEHNPTHFAFLEFQINGESAGRLDIELFGNEAPKTVNNFLALCTGDHSKQLNYKGCPVHRIVPGYLIQTGDFTKGDGTGGVSIYQECPDSLFSNQSDNFLKFNEPYLLAMANKGPDANGSQFFITLDDLSYLNGKYTIFGRVKRNTALVDLIAAQGTPSGQPLTNVVLSNTGVYLFQQKAKPTLLDPTIQIKTKLPDKKV